jgi:hypothetical protein
MAMALCNSADRKRLRSMTKDCFGSQTHAIIGFKSSIGVSSDRDWFGFWVSLVLNRVNSVFLTACA